MDFDDPAFTVPTGSPAPLDPQIARFVEQMAAEGRKYPRRDTLPIAEARRIAEKVRAPWAAGGPAMAHVDEYRVPTRHGDVRIRVYRPAACRLPGALVYLPGGGFVLFSVDTHDRLMREYAERAGIVVIGVDYPRAPEARFPRPLEACIDAVQWIGANAAELRIDAGQLFIGGDSAGANLSVGTALALRGKGGTNDLGLAGLVLNYGTFGNNLFRNSVVRYGAGDYGLSAHMMIWFRGMYIERGQDLRDPRYDLMRADVAGLPPVWMVITECDPLRDDSVEFQRKLERAGVDVLAKTYRGTVHSFLEAVSIADVASTAFDDTTQWLHRMAARTSER
ncbi:alpha/beta hydrolase fold domain-containing protein [Caballeronia sp. 15711]|uniref:alpha/beta hydrolase fold domain-containing protein n=1 Tax=Caballeronia sp. 15711 TaxID=3391029 RepID=UPI0039E67A8C